MLHAICAHYGKSVKMEKYVGVEELPQALTGANFLICAIQVGGYDPCTISDFEIPKKYGLRHKKQLIPQIMEAYKHLDEEYDVIVIEGAGSPAEINLKSDDIVNMGLAAMVDAPVLLAGDIDRGGVFAQLYGTVELLEPEERKRIKGLIINKFRKGSFC